VPERIVVFLDWQNVYRRGRDAFGGLVEPHTYGQVNPIILAERLVAKRQDAVLRQVRIYRGLPTNHADARGYAANRRQTAAWMTADRSRTVVFLRPLQYLPGLAPREKGIDVQLALDFVVLGISGAYDLGILVSGDTDLVPALDVVHDLNGKERPWAAVAAWSGPNCNPRRIRASGKRSVPCLMLTEDDFKAAADDTDYSL
jgi:hypothetical protein